MESKIIILCGGTIDFYSLPVNTNTSNSMIPINGKPVIAWILEDLKRKELQQITLVLRKDDHHLKDFINRVYKGSKNGMQIELVFVGEGGTIVESLQAGINSPQKAQQVSVILGDTLITDPFQAEDNFLYIHEVPDSHRWCLAVLDSDHQVTSYHDKQENVPSPYQAVCGFYKFSDMDWLKQCVEHTIAEQGRQLSDVLIRYGEKYPIRARQAENWFDFGNIDNLVKAKQQLLQSRFFNSLSIDPVLNTITKVSTFDQKLNNELNWYLNLPVELQVLTPRIISSQQIEGKLNLVQEYYGYPTLAELYLYSDIHAENWIIIINKLLNLHQEFCKYPADLPEQSFRKVYIGKTFQRLESVRGSDGDWDHLFTHEYINYNGQRLLNLDALLPFIEKRAEAISTNATGTIIHGDFCFSNILFDINGQIARLIDPRGSFGEPGIYGDPRYDLAKLRHSISGLYDYIISDLFELSYEGTTFEARIFFNQTAQYLGQKFDKMISKIGYDPLEIKFIEALLFISMLPLHSDKPQRQKMMYLRGLVLLNEIYKCE